MRRNLQRWRRNIGGNIGGRGASPNTYGEAIGSVLWPTVVSRPDVAYAVRILLQFIQNPGPDHWEALKRVIIYLQTTKTLWLTFRGKSKQLVEGFCDADWASQKHRHSISGYSFYFGQEAIAWSSKKQHIIALSSTEAEYIMQTHATKEALWLWGFISKIREPQQGLITVNCDNQGAIALSKDNKFHSWTKHIDLWYHFIREAVKDDKITFTYILTEENVSDIFTKALTWLKFVHFVKNWDWGSLSRFQSKLRPGYAHEDHLFNWTHLITRACFCHHVLNMYM